MYVPFHQLPASARLWIYQANRPFTPTEQQALQPVLQQFATDWTSHGRALAASAVILHHQFLVIGLDEAVADASGCSIDASVRFVQGLEQQLEIQLLEKSQMAFLVSGEVQLLSRQQLKQAISNGTVAADTPYFDNTVATQAQLQTKWPAPAVTTWLAPYFSPGNL
ncbi:hypothetical protein ACFPAF_17655 [Hymenobacter endophyticus]|uniref:ABC transporter ATPase n=1 Tax=Hymenobacter endophyticus TaxID=3076335 RepID=A0ABU3TLI6_9BACT|nr:hypothetical protein [Hymenobacter endophyticus]MDU0372233.1 hypothetical protein [Hymenobacter endophyticus]